MSKHTKGPWVWGEYNSLYAESGDATEEILYAGYDCNVWIEKANANLIAAAPDLYESAINAQKLLRTLYHEAKDHLAKYLILERLNELDASIKKARTGV